MLHVRPASNDMATKLKRFEREEFPSAMTIERL